VPGVAVSDFDQTATAQEGSLTLGSVGARGRCAMSKTDQLWPKYTAEQISEIIDRMTTLRTGWIRQVKIQLASQQSRPVLDDYRLSGEPAE
jgi:hypothetical protein